MPTRASSALLSGPACLVPVEFPAATAQQASPPDFNFLDVPRLCTALRAGDESAFRFLHEQWNQRIVRYCFALTAGNDTLAMECVQATYLRVLKQVRPLPDEPALWNWIACASRCAATDLYRVGGRYRRAIQRFTDWLHLGSGVSREPAEEFHLFNALDGALDALDEDERLLLEARYFQRASLEDIARLTGVTARAVEGRLARIRDRLRNTMASTLRNQSL